jgi:altronate hydrolase
MKHTVLTVHPGDNVMVALEDLQKGTRVETGSGIITLTDDIPAKHKFFLNNMQPGDEVIMYGVLVGKTTSSVSRGGLMTTENVRHAAGTYTVKDNRNVNWDQPDITPWHKRHFMGYHRSDGKVGTANYWLVVPMVFCENRNLSVLEEALVKNLGYGIKDSYRQEADQLIALYKAGKTVEEILNADLQKGIHSAQPEPLFKHVDGIKFLQHDGGCGGTRQDAEALCALLAGYITHPNVAGATVLSLGCQHAQVAMLEEAIQKISPAFNKPLFILEQQKVGMETDLMALAIRQTFAGLIQANECRRAPAPLSKLCVGLECGGSDGFSGISANPAIGYTSDLIVALGGSVILSEFPELCGVEQELSDRCISMEKANRFTSLMTVYNDRARAVGSGFDMNPSPGNIKDGLITDAIKSAGAAKKGGTSPVADVLDYTEQVSKPGLTLLCTPGNDVESTTAEVGSGANIVLFTTGLGTPTGNPIAPVIKISSNTALYERMKDIIDINTGTIIEGSETIEEAGRRILEYIIEVASGERIVNAVRLGQDDFIPWKRGVSL